MDDWVAIASYLTVIVSVIVVAFLFYKGYNLIWKDGGDK